MYDLINQEQTQWNVIRISKTDIDRHLANLEEDIELSVQDCEIVATRLRVALVENMGDLVESIIEQLVEEVKRRRFPPNKKIKFYNSVPGYGYLIRNRKGELATRTIWVAKSINLLLNKQPHQINQELCEVIGYCDDDVDYDKLTLTKHVKVISVFDYRLTGRAYLKFCLWLAQRAITQAAKHSFLDLSGERNLRLLIHDLEVYLEDESNDYESYRKIWENTSSSLNFSPSVMPRVSRPFDVPPPSVLELLGETIWQCIAVSIPGDLSEQVLGGLYWYRALIGSVFPVTAADRIREIEIINDRLVEFVLEAKNE